MRILLVEDETTLAKQIGSALAAAAYTVDVAVDGVDGHFLGVEQDYDAVVLDLGLPLLDGISVLKRWRNAGRSMPVLILTARADWHERVAGIDAGADDYLTKPFHMEELLARIRALIRRAQGRTSDELCCGPLRLNTRSAVVHLDDQALNLTSHEFKLLSLFMHRPGEVIPRGELVDHIYAQDSERDSNTIEVFIGRLRKKLPPELIETLRGLGYRLKVPPR